MLQGSVAQW